MATERPSTQRGRRGWFRSRPEAAARFSGSEAWITGTRARRRFVDSSCGVWTDGTADAADEGSREAHAFAGAACRRTVQGAREAISVARGAALAGERAAAFFDGATDGALGAVRRAASEHVPLVCHGVTATAGGHDAYHDLADSGAFLAFAADAQRAVDLSLVAARVAEQALLPGVIFLDRAETGDAVSRVRMPEARLVREYLGDPAERVDCPTPAQRLLFGSRRRRVPRWFDLDRPTAHGLEPSDASRDAALLGRRIFFSEHLEDHVAEALRSLGELTGREQGPLRRFALRKAERIWLLQGAAIETAELAADYLRRTHGLRIGVLGLEWLRPLPVQQLRRWLPRDVPLTVIERVELEGIDGPPLAREIRRALGEGAPPMRSATYGRIRADQLVALGRRPDEAAAPRIRLGAAHPGSEGGFPKRQALLQRVQRDYPVTSGSTLPVPADPTSGLLPEAARAFGLLLWSERSTASRLEALAAKLSGRAGPHLVSRLWPAGPRASRARFVAAPDPLRDPGTGWPLQRLLVADTDLLAECNPFDDVAEGGAAFILSVRDGVELWSSLPRACRESVRQRGIRLYRGAADASAIVDGAWATDALPAPGWEELAWCDLGPAEAAAEPDLPLAVRRFAETGGTLDSAARFWGEFAQPRASAGGRDEVPDPYLAVGSVPAGTATFFDRSATRAWLPRIDPERCSGCGRCWISCPDSSIAALALNSESLLGAAAKRAAAEPAAEPDAEAERAAGRLQRAHRQLAARLDELLAKSEERRLRPERLREAFDWLVGKMKVADEEREALQRAFAATQRQIEGLPWSVTQLLFREAHAAQKGSGDLLMLAVDPRSCQACGVCVEVCPDEAFRREPQTGASLEEARTLWRAWESLPDTTGASISRVAQQEQVGELPAVLLSRHCLFSAPGGDPAEPGSGARLALRQTLAVVEFQTQRAALERAAALEDLARRLEEAVKQELARAVALEDLEPLARVLEEAGGGAAGVASILSRLERQGASPEIDVPRLQQLVRLAREVSRARWRLVEGPQGQGRARYGVVIADERVARWAAAFPRNPLVAPLVADLTGDGADTALGLLDGLLRERLEEVRLLRGAELVLENPSDLPARERETAALSVTDLTEAERRAVAPVLVVLSAGALGGPLAAGFSRLLRSGLPAKLLCLDDCDLLGEAPDPAHLALAHREAFLLCSSPAHPAHLFAGVSAAIEFPGPAVIHLPAPSPALHGFAAERVLERARAAVEARVHPLLRYDPRAPGVFGLRIDLDGNPSPDAAWATNEEGRPVTPADWAAGESRYREFLAPDGPAASQPERGGTQEFPDARGSELPTVPGPNGADLAVGDRLAAAIRRRAERWAVFQELAGRVTPFTEKIRLELEQRVERAHADALAAREAEHRATTAALDQEERGRQAARLRERLLQLLGYDASREVPPSGGERPS